MGRATLPLWLTCAHLALFLPPPAGAAVGEAPSRKGSSSSGVPRAAAEQLLPGGQGSALGPQTQVCRGSGSGPCPDAWTPCMSLFETRPLQRHLSHRFQEELPCVGQVGLKSNDKVLIKADGGWTQTQEKASRMRGQRPWRCRRLLRAGGGAWRLEEPTHRLPAPGAGNETCSSGPACGSVCAAQRAVHGLQLLRHSPVSSHHNLLS